MNDLARSAYQLFGIRLTPVQMNAFDCFEKELLDWNTRFNLTAIQERDQVRIKHFLDSLSCLVAFRDSPTGSLIDVGTGAGFPGLAIKIACPSIHVTLVESVAKKANFCRHMVTELGLDGVEVVVNRVEALGLLPAYRQRFDWAVARAVAIMPVLAEFLLPLVRVGGRMLAMKGASAPAETQSAENALRLLGGHLRRIMPITLPGVAEERYLVVVDKIAATPDGYPRRVGIPAKRPLE